MKLDVKLDDFKDGEELEVSWYGQTDWTLVRKIDNKHLLVNGTPFSIFKTDKFRSIPTSKEENQPGFIVESEVCNNFEQQLIECWSVTNDLTILNEGILDSCLTTDQISNIVLGMKELYELKFDKLFKQFEKFPRNV